MHAFVFCFLLLCSHSIASFAEASKTLSGFSINLIHRESPLSPFYNPSLTPSERIKNTVLRSFARSKRRLRLSQNDDRSPGTITIPDEPITEYLMRFYIGTPPVERFAIADTGSDLIWVQCAPCEKCVPQNAPLFDPRKSSTFKTVPCDSQPCTLLPPSQRACVGKSGQCYYQYIYGDHTLVSGILGFESINFGSKNNAIKFPKLTFGCTFSNNDTVDESKRNMGLVGLGVGPLSLISQLGYQIGRKFSYCFPPLSSNSTSKMRFGNDAIVKQIKGVVSTPLIIKSIGPSYYYLNLEGVSIGNKKVKTSESQTDGNILIDSGTSFTILKQSFYNKFVALVKEVYGVEAVKIPPLVYNFCFENKGKRKRFPDVVFLFTGAKVRVDASNLFEAEDNNLLCMVALPTSDEDDSIFGNHAQIGYQVEYDLQGGMVSFAPADCAKD
ncbi:hypothetical protein AAZX31_08G164100 [Glycine max]|uniref:Peptidase A1 domain-containing protein n=2 Tax=Glycine subgen. Soja TaxID=1462606 RepID=I1KTY3_SOYBN|nr:probable aspartic protease At2g35615 [Glycine max]XP_028246985.1 probable aspartic protease At2g35615 [Glycine soja]KAG5025671.1 hypothetical protein JHK86_021585 [Glycine max]KAH1051581.1 hypothetical protein GYH30_021465 [Glycine max]KHN21392.1 Putative aspartic protease [Glycine soja]KRH43709.1 hypothetical protein GLYMA_08G166000v4 [Glycine max]RZB97241.1 putative aspartic protease [Glycine soja]|eukprot:XP_003532923.1 probable aspartic protease At2g35615 [Glycine max]